MRIIKSLYKIRWFQVAKLIAKHSDHRIQVGAVICNNKPISLACNLVKTHPQHTNGIINAIHAEVRAIITSNVKDLTGSTIYVYRETKDGKPALSRPCNYCYKMIKKAGIKKIYYTTDTKPYYCVERVK